MDSSPVRDPIRLLISELVRGKESLTTLRRKLCGESGSGSDKELVAEVEKSFTASLAILRSSGMNEPSQIAVSGGGKRASPVDRSSKGSDHGKKRPGFKDRRGCYRRRNSAESWIVLSPTTEDGFAWRKYGQKEILNTKFPRCYFRCTHKHDQGCKATRQVQRIKEDPHQYQITYFGEHTCQNTLMRTPQIISEPDPMDSYLMSFETRTTASSKVVLKANLQDETQSDVTDTKSCLGSSMWHDRAESSGGGGQRNANSNSGVYNEPEVASSLRHSSCSSTPLQDLDMAAFGTKFDDLDQDLYMDDVGEYFGNHLAS